MKTLDLRIKLLLSGIAAGDSLGSTSEFFSQDEIPELYNRLKGDGWPFKQVGAGSLGLSPGDPTDDAEMALCIVRPFMESRKFDPAMIAREFVSWMKSGPKDIGNATYETLRTCEKSKNYWDGGLLFWRRQPRHAANGSLMRNGVVPAMAETLDDAFSMTLKHGMITHYAPLPQVCCMAQTYLIWELLSGKSYSEGWQGRFEESLAHYFDGIQDPEVEQWLKEVKEADHLDRAMDTFNRANWIMDEFNPFFLSIRGNGGYCLLTLQIALWALYWSLRKEVPEIPEGFPKDVFDAEGPSRLAWVAMIGHDADTYGATAGPLIAAAHSTLPSGMIEGLKVLQIFE